MTTELRQRARPPAHAPDAPTIPATTHELDLEHPSGEQKYGRARQMFRQISFGLYFVLCVLGYVREAGMELLRSQGVGRHAGMLSIVYRRYAADF